MMNFKELSKRARSFLTKKKSIALLQERNVERLDISLPIKKDIAGSIEYLTTLIVLSPWCALQDRVRLEKVGDDGDRKLRLQFSAVSKSGGEQIVGMIKQEIARI